MTREPYLWKHKKNDYYYVIHYDGPLGERKRMESLKTKQLSVAQDRLFLWKQQRATEQSLGIKQLGVSLQEASSEYLKHFEKRNKEVSVHRYRNALDNVINFVNKDLPIGSLRVKDLQDYQLHRIAKADKRTVDYEMDVMRAFLNWCRKRAWVRENVADNEHLERLIKAGHTKQEKRIFTDDELDKLLTLDGQLFPVICNKLYYTGMRIGELSHLQLTDVKLNRQEIHIREKTLKVPVWNQAVREIQWTPKSYERRIIPIEARLEPILRQFQEQRTDNIYGLYFLSRLGNQITDPISRQIKTVTGKNDVSVHTFRHTHISHALKRWGRHPSVVQRWVGHKDLKTTMQYLHVSVEDLHREALKTGLSG